jgi:serine/threonine protein kinase
VHSAFIVHSDIKPDNFMVDTRGRVFIIDFGLSSLYYNVEKDVYKENKPCEHLIGSPKFASYNLHVGNSISPRDDMMSLGYMMLYLFHMEIPWANMSDEVDSELPLYNIHHPSNIKRARLKRAVNNHLLNDTPTFATKYLVSYFDQITSLQFRESPDYKSYRELFSTLC